MKNSGLLLLKRANEDILTNNFNLSLMNIHRANIDIQYVTDEYAVAEYVSNYCTKMEGGSSALLRNINEQCIAEGDTARDTLSKLSKALDRGREVGIQEAIYRLLGLTMTKFSEVVKFINAAHPHRRDGLLRQEQDLENLEPGESVFHNSPHDYYMSRPMNTPEDDTDWEKMSLAEFVSKYNIVKKKPENPRNETVKLENNKGYAVKRQKECVIRYFLRYDNDQEYHRALCVLFLPFRNEMVDIHNENVTDLYKDNEDQIENVRSKFERHRKIVDLMAEVERKQQNNLGEIDEDDEEEEVFQSKETTTNAEIKDFENIARASAKALLKQSAEDEMPPDEYLEKINSLNSEQRQIFDDVVERLLDVESDPFYLYIGGEAGTGKSYLLRLLKEAAKRLPKFSGQELDKPLSITLAPTGVAAYIIGGSTIESGLSMPVGRIKDEGSQAKNSELRFIYEDLKVIFLDEVSMCGCDTLYDINIRLQTIRGNRLFMGGVSVICFGDFGQLPPVGQHMIFDTSHRDGRADVAENYWFKYFKIYYMKEKMRSKDNTYSDICDKVRRGEKTEDVTSYLKNRERPCPNENNLRLYQEGKISIIVTTNKDRHKINLQKLDELIPEHPPVMIAASDKSTNVYNPPPLDPNLPMTKTGQLENTVIFKKGAPVMVTSNSSVKRHKKNGIVNGIRGFIDSFQYSKDDPNTLEVIWVRFNDDKTGQLLRDENLNLLKNHTPDDKLSVPILRQKKTFNQQGSTTWLREQFPLTLSFAVTAHKVINSNYFLLLYM